MLGDFITRGLVLVLGYAYPAFECFKTMEKNRVEIEELRFWCQYWIIVAVLTVCERFGDIFISWLPLYGEIKLALFIYLWHPKTKGSGYVYENILRPNVAKYETDIDRSLQEMKARAWDLATHHFQNCTKMGQTTFVQIIQYLASQSAKIKKEEVVVPVPVPAPVIVPEKEQTFAPLTPSPRAPSSLPNTPKKQRLPGDKRRPPIHPPTLASTLNRAAVVQSPKSNAAKIHLHGETEFIRAENDDHDDHNAECGSTDDASSNGGVDESLNAARLRLRRSKAFH